MAGMPSELSLPEPLPSDPMPLFQEWFKDAAARRTQPNPDAMVVATAASNGGAGTHGISQHWRSNC